MIDKGQYFKLVTTQISSDDDIHHEKVLDLKSLVNAYDEDDIPIITGEANVSTIVLL